MEMVLFSDMFGTVCVMNIFILLLFDLPARSICKIDIYERAANRESKIYLGKWSFLFFTYAKEKDWYPKKTIVLELVTYFLFVVTLIFSALSIFLKSNVILLWILAGWLLLVSAFCGYINNMEQRRRYKY